MPYVNYFVGLFLAYFLFILAKKNKMLDSGEFYFSVLMAVTTYYIAFAFEHEKYILTEVLGSVVFAMLGLFFLRKSMMILAVLIMSHGVYDYFHAVFIPNSGAPIWWPGFCGTFDVAFGAFLVIFMKNKNRGL